MTEEKFDRVIAVNLKGTHLVNQAFAKAAVEKQNQLSIVNFSSIVGKVSRGPFKGQKTENIKNGRKRQHFDLVQRISRPARCIRAFALARCYSNRA